jgi:GNAT superfamily N-acetyltransferase
VATGGEPVATGWELATPRSRGGRENGLVSDYRLSEDPADLDLDRVVRWISTDAYWAKGRTRETVERSFANSFPAGLYAHDGQQVAVARIVSDRATFAWLCDVYVDREHRGRGLGTILANWTVTWAGRHGIKRVVLATMDAHGVYEKAGFAPVGHPERWMEIDTRPAFGQTG